MARMRFKLRYPRLHLLLLYFSPTRRSNKYDQSRLFHLYRRLVLLIMPLINDANNAYHLENVPHGLMQPASATGVGEEPGTNQPNWQLGVTESANIVEDHRECLVVLQRCVLLGL